MAPQLLSDVREYLELLRDETWRRHDSAMSEDTIAREVTEVMLKVHPDWDGQEWIRPGVGCLCAEHAMTGDEPEAPEHQLRPGK